MKTKRRFCVLSALLPATFFLLMGCPALNTGTFPEIKPPITVASPPTNIYLTTGSQGHILRVDDMTGTHQIEYHEGSTLGVTRVYGMYVTGNLHLYVADSANHRILHFNYQRELVESFGTRGTGQGQFLNPQGIWLDGGFIYVADSGNNRIVRMNNMKGDYWATYYGGRNGFQSPSSICVNDHFIYIADTGNNRIIRIGDMLGNGYKTYGHYGQDGQPGSIIYPRGVFAQQGKIYFTDVYRVVRMDDMNGTGWITYGTSGNGIDQFRDAQGLCVDEQGLCVDEQNKIYVADAINKRIVRIDNMTGGAGLLLPDLALTTLSLLSRSLRSRERQISGIAFYAVPC